MLVKARLTVKYNVLKACEYTNTSLYFDCKFCAVDNPYVLYHNSNLSKQACHYVFYLQQNKNQHP